MRRILTITAAISIIVLATACDPDDISDGECNAGELCLWEHAYQGGLVADPGCCDGEWAGGYGNYSQDDYWNTDTSPNDETSMIWNRVTSHAYTTVYEDAIGGGRELCTIPGLSIPDLSTSSLSFPNDSLSSSFSSSYSPCT